ncbi:MAG: histidine kinase, partial [Ignavibacteria bacterium]|nr:histidine kinase [Ignavibacteria bacterium]
DLVPAKDFYSSALNTLNNSNSKNIAGLANYVGGLLSTDIKKKNELFRNALFIQQKIVKEFPDDKKAKETLAMILNSNGKIEQAIKVAEEIGNNWLQIVYLNNYGFDKVQEKKYDEALNIFLRSLQLCKIERNKTLLRNIYDNIGRIYRLKGNWQKAAEYQQLMHLVEENLYSERFSFQVSEFKVKYDLEKKEIENTLLAKNIAIQKNLNYVLIVSVTVISLILLIVFMSKKRLKFAYALLDEQNKEISSKKIELEGINKVLHESEYNLKEAQATANLANWELDLQNNKLQFSDQFLKIFESTKERLESSFNGVLDELVDADDKATVINFFWGNVNETAREEIEFRIRNNNLTKWIKAYKVSLINELSNGIRLFGTVQDITELKEKERIKIEIAAQQSFSHQLIQSQEEERKRIAGELHDSLGQDVLLIKNRVLLGLQNEEIDHSSLNQLTEINKSVSAVLNSIRDISFNLRPAHLERLGLT